MTASSRYRNVGKGGEAYFVLAMERSFGSHSGPSRGDSRSRAFRPKGEVAGSKNVWVAVDLKRNSSPNESGLFLDPEHTFGLTVPTVVGIASNLTVPSVRQPLPLHPKAVCRSRREKDC